MIDTRLSDLGFLTDDNQEQIEPINKITALTQKLEEMDEKINKKLES